MTPRDVAPALFVGTASRLTAEPCGSSQLCPGHGSGAARPSFPFIHPPTHRRLCALAAPCCPAASSSPGAPTEADGLLCPNSQRRGRGHPCSDGQTKPAGRGDGGIALPERGLRRLHYASHKGPCVQRGGEGKNLAFERAYASHLKSSHLFSHAQQKAAGSQRDAGGCSLAQRVIPGSLCFSLGGQAESPPAQSSVPSLPCQRSPPAPPGSSSPSPASGSGAQPFCELPGQSVLCRDCPLTLPRLLSCTGDP